MKLSLFFYDLIKKLPILFCMLGLFLLKSYSQPGPSNLYVLVFDKKGEKMILKKDIEMFSYIPASVNKLIENSYNLKYGENPCSPDINNELICTSIVTESPVNVILIIHNNDTMNLIIKNYSAYGFELLIDSLIFSNGWYELKNDNNVGYNNKGEYILENNMKLKYDSCFTGLSRISNKFIIPSSKKNLKTSKM